MMHEALLKRLGIGEVGSGIGTRAGNSPAGGPEIVSYNPADGKPLARVLTASRADCEHAVETRNRRSGTGGSAGPPTRRDCPPARSGVAGREIDLGLLVTLEAGKIRSEGLGEVQEMIDMCDFAVGLSRQLYGLTIASERPAHRMFEQWHPLGPVGVITAFNFPVAVWAWNADVAAVCGDTCVWKPSS